MLLSFTGIMLHDIAVALSTSSVQTLNPTRKAVRREAEDEVDSLARRIRRSLHRSSSFQSIQTLAAQSILTAAFAARGFYPPEASEATPNQIREALQNGDLIEFVTNHLVDPPQRNALIGGEMLAEFHNTVEILEKAARAFR